MSDKIILKTDDDVIVLAARMGLPMDKFANRQRAVNECLGMAKDKAIVKLDNIMWGC